MNTHTSFLRIASFVSVVLAVAALMLGVPNTRATAASENNEALLSQRGSDELLFLHAGANGNDPEIQSDYSVAQEIRVLGTVENIRVLSVGRAAYTHILVKTPTGLTDVQLGYADVADPQFLGLAVGKAVEIVGIQAGGNHTVLLARILMTPSHIFILRNEQGAPKSRF
jgi:hypothetical protein